MAFSKEKAFERAERYAAKGQHDKAAREYQSIIDADPKELRAWLMLADCLVRCGDAAKAIDRYMQVGQYYVQQKDYHKALAVYRQVLNLDGARLDVQLRVAALNRELGRIPDAIATYERVAGVQLHMGQVVDALQTYKLVADIDPTAVSRRLRLAELYSRERRTAEAVDAFRAAGAQLLKEGRKSDYVRVAERLLYHDAGDLPTVRELASIYLELGDPRRALMKLNALLHANHNDREGLELLARTFIALGKPDKAISVVSELVRALRSAGPDARDDLLRVLRQAVEWAPTHAEFRDSLAQLEGVSRASMPRLQIGARLADGDLGLDDVDEADVVEIDDHEVVVEEADSEPIAIEEGEDLEVGSTGPLTRSVLSEAADNGGVDTDTLTDFDKILFEARVYIKYRLFEHALDHVRVALKQQPDHVGALGLLARALAELQRSHEAADAHLRVGRLVFASDPKLAREHVAAALTLVPGHVAALQLQGALTREEPSARVGIGRGAQAWGAARAGHPREADVVAVRGVPEDEDFTIEVEQSEADEVQTGPEVEIEDRFGLDEAPYADVDVRVTAEYGAPDEAPVEVSAELLAADPFEIEGPGHEPPAPNDRDLLGAAQAREFDELEGDEFADFEAELAADQRRPTVDMLDLGGEDESITLSRHDEADDRPQPLLPDEPDLVSLALDLDAPGSRQVLAPPPRAAEPPPAATPVRAASPAAASAWPDLSDDLAEIRFYLDQGLDDDAEAALSELRRRHPGHPELAAMSGAIDRDAPVPVAAEAAAPLVSLDDPADEDAYLDAIFSDPAPRRKKAEATGARVASPVEDSQTAFDLGVAYREMGLVDEAVSQFTAASRDGRIRVRALVMLGTLRVHQGQTDQAITDLEQAVTLASNDDEIAEANYELGALYETLGDRSAAIACLSQVSIGYRDRDERLARLQG